MVAVVISMKNVSHWLWHLNAWSLVPVEFLKQLRQAGVQVGSLKVSAYVGCGDYLQERRLRLREGRLRLFFWKRRGKGQADLCCDLGLTKIPAQ